MNQGAEIQNQQLLRRQETIQRKHTISAQVQAENEAAKQEEIELRRHQKAVNAQNARDYAQAVAQEREEALAARIEEKNFRSAQIKAQ